MKFIKSSVKNKKYRIISPQGKIIDFGDIRYEHYKDQTNLKLYSNLDHLDHERRIKYRARASKIKNKYNQLTYNNPEYANYYSYNYLW
jgi:hypothetical protein